MGAGGILILIKKKKNLNDLWGKSLRFSRGIRKTEKHNPKNDRYSFILKGKVDCPTSRYREISETVRSKKMLKCSFLWKYRVLSGLKCLFEELSNRFPSTFSKIYPHIRELWLLFFFSFFILFSFLFLGEFEGNCWVRRNRTCSSCSSAK